MSPPMTRTKTQGLNTLFKVRSEKVGSLGSEKVGPPNGDTCITRAFAPGFAYQEDQIEEENEVKLRDK